LQRDVVVGQQAAHDRQVLGEAVRAPIKGEAEGSMLGHLVAGADAEQQPTRGQLLQGAGHLGQQGRVAECGGRDQAADLDALGGRPDCREQRPGLGVRLEDIEP
jgi:hypothetical protein